MRVSVHNAPAPSKPLLALGFGAIYVLWGSTYLAIGYTVETLPPFLMAGTRAFAAGAVLFVVVGLPRLHSLTAAHWRSATISGGLFFLGCHGLLFRMEKSVESGVAALLLATIPGWMVAFSCLARRRAPTVRTTVGLLLGLAGVAVLVLPTGDHALAECSPVAACVLLVSAMSWAIGSMYCRSASLPEHTGTGTAMQLLCGGALAMLAGLLAGEGHDLELANVTSRSAVSLLYLVVFGSLISFTAYTWLLRVMNPEVVGTYAYVNPVIAVLLGWLLGGELLSPRAIAAAAVVVLGVVSIHHDPDRLGPKASYAQAGSRETEGGSRVGVGSVRR